MKYIYVLHIKAKRPAGVIGRADFSLCDFYNLL